MLQNNAREYNITCDRLRGLMQYWMEETNSLSKTSKLLFTSPSHVMYWCLKKSDPTFHSGSWGGARNSIFSPDEIVEANDVFIRLVKMEPDVNLQQIAEVLGFYFERNISKTTMSRILRKWGWRWTIPSIVQINKFTPENIAYYIDYVNWVTRVDWQKVKFVDESHVVPKALGKKKKVITLKGRKVYLRDNSLHKKHVSITLLTSLGNLPALYSDIREQSNTAYDFLEFIKNCIADKRLNDGDFLVCDNASVHGSEDTIQQIFDLFDHFNIKLIFLPTYSPELNPCELVFNVMKNNLRKFPSQQTLQQEIAEALKAISWDDVKNMYYNCVRMEEIVKKTLYMTD